MKIKIIVSFLIVFSLLASCKKDIAKEPAHLIEKAKMVDIMYDLSLIGAMRNQNSALLDSFKNNSNQYIYKKYKIDSIQFVQSNIYYAADYKEYKKMYEQVKSRLEKNKSLTEVAIKVEKKNAILLEKKNKKLKLKKEADSIKKAKLKVAKEKDSLIKDSIRRKKVTVSNKKPKKEL
ncbi:protein of unknown function [Flavobacterium fluvii]|uniref:DUF4296 domain-containing protein n=1 Tax=Flavobacterium fluvii TaxID=468056 RepID=A0A1M5FMS1_9FLAO|nr:DUF4296 domain-containing protein [Flavobacterium fluvii]SHF92820.1 protein of unknown function [Flavobacterium fluvii]